jgi:starvation-inducible DNA-binding protein
VPILNGNEEEEPMAKKPAKTSDAKRVAEAAARLLADSYTLYLKTHNYHWNVTGPMFTTLHTLFETEYNELALAVDEIAERIRALGEVAPGSYTEFARLSKVKEARGVPAAREMIRQLVADNRTVAATAQQLFDVADQSGDQGTADLATRRIQVAEKTCWMLQSHLE